jgi:hypothetical protein
MAIFSDKILYMWSNNQIFESLLPLIQKISVLSISWNKETVWRARND